ncbi:hypothetical protein GCM10010472_69400 [Pseudonocardia halophobica]|uniref:Deazaflavin-dependent oxidoreductase, nitroreductase family n=1 Tax=Pseudonocardia halophobica TaxID=29401 RepID=A0A9W6UG88_9PSEU|nr:nitroreductase/quinone reductase family protein [Pseudonocardia halophobica]GLL15849.1 hypothetical protein GCM10017577_70030 [Pseudonocardia halophobica]
MWDEPLARGGVERLEAAFTGGLDTDLDFVRGFNDAVVAELRAHGQVRGEDSGKTRLVLTVRGRSSGSPRAVPTSYLVVDGRLLVVASRGGSDEHPQWYRNLLATPEVGVELNGRAFDAVARPTEGADRDALFQAIAAAAPHFARYQRRTARALPVVELLGARLTAEELAAGLRTA